MPNINGDPSYDQMLADPEVVAAAERLFNKFHAWPMKTTWADLPTHVELGLINYRYLMLSYAWTARRLIWCSMGDLASQIMVHSDLFLPPMSCECCGTMDHDLKSCRIMGAGCVCSDCIHVWYEYGLTDSDAIGAKVLDLRSKRLRP